MQSRMNNGEGTMDIKEANEKYEKQQTVKYKGHEYPIEGVNELNDTVTLPLEKGKSDVKVEELD